MTVLAQARTRFTRLLADSSAAPNAQLFARDVLDEWGLAALAEPACAGIEAFVGWVLGHGSNVQVEIVLVWDADQELLFAEVADHGQQLPGDDLPGAGGCEERGAAHRGHGRVLWASYSTARPEQLAPGGAR